MVHAETLLTVDGLSISYFEDEPGRQSATKLLSKGARRIVFLPLCQRATLVTSECVSL